MRQQRQQKRHRYVLEEPHIPFECEVLYENDAIIVVDKPHFLATTPRGMWYRETALIRLREQYGEPDIVPAHRLDRLTAGIIVFVRKPELRGAYQMLFQNPAIRASHICKDRGRLQAYEIPETINAQTLIERGSTVRCFDGKAYVNYVLHPKTGKTHQLRVHMNSLGLPILGDDFYPNIVQRSYDDFSQPLELVARELRFDDPVTGEPRTFVSKVPLG